MWPFTGPDARMCGAAMFEMNFGTKRTVVPSQQPFPNEPLFRAVDPISNDFFAYYYGSFFRRGREQREAGTTRERQAFLVFASRSAIDRPFNEEEQTHPISKLYVHAACHFTKVSIVKMWSFALLLQDSYHNCCYFSGVSYIFGTNNQPLRWTSFFAPA